MADLPPAKTGLEWRPGADIVICPMCERARMRQLADDPFAGVSIHNDVDDTPERRLAKEMIRHCLEYLKATVGR